MQRRDLLPAYHRCHMANDATGKGKAEEIKNEGASHNSDAAVLDAVEAIIVGIKVVEETPSIFAGRRGRWNGPPLQLALVQSLPPRPGTKRKAMLRSGGPRAVLWPKRSPAPPPLLWLLHFEQYIARLVLA